MKPEGRMITIAAGDEDNMDPRVKKNFFIVEPSRKQLVEVAKLIDAGSLKTFVKRTFSLSAAGAAYAEMVPQKGGHGKIVIKIA